MELRLENSSMTGDCGHVRVHGLAASIFAAEWVTGGGSWQDCYGFCPLHLSVVHAFPLCKLGIRYRLEVAVVNVFCPLA